MNNVVTASGPLATSEYNSVKRNNMEKLLSMQTSPGMI
jgi:hypothetical protein